MPGDLLVLSGPLRLCMFDQKIACAGEALLVLAVRADRDDMSGVLGGFDPAAGLLLGAGGRLLRADRTAWDMLRPMRIETHGTAQGGHEGGDTDPGGGGPGGHGIEQKTGAA